MGKLRYMSNLYYRSSYLKFNQRYSENADSYSHWNITASKNLICNQDPPPPALSTSLKVPTFKVPTFEVPTVQSSNWFKIPIVAKLLQLNAVLWTALCIPIRMDPKLFAS